MKIKVGGAPVPEDCERVEAALEVRRGKATARGGCERRIHARACARLCAGARAVRLALVRRADGPARLCAACRSRRSSTRRRSAPARTCSPRRTSRTWCASAACAPIATSSRSTFRSRTASCSSRARWRCWSATAGSRQSIFPHGGNQMTLHIVGGFGLGGCEAYPDVFGPFAGFADDAKVDDGWLAASRSARHRVRSAERSLRVHENASRNSSADSQPVSRG